MIREAGKEDIPVIRQLVNAIWPVAYKDILSAQQIEYMIDLMYSASALSKQMTELNHRFIVSIEEEPTGFASWSEKSGEPHIFRLNKLYVLPSCQGKGQGKQLVDYIEIQIRSQHALSLELNVNRLNPAIHFYEKLGFRVAGEEDIDIGNGFFMNDYIMRKDFQPANTPVGGFV